MLASSPSEVEAAQRLRFGVFARELGARLESHEDGLDRDRSTADGGHYAASLHRQLDATHAGPEAWRVFPRERLPVESLQHGCEVVVPPPVKGYLRAGGQLIGEPHHDRAFGCADFPMLLSLERLAGRYSRRFIRAR